jgi:pilus assembly protein CpaB
MKKIIRQATCQLQRFSHNLTQRLRRIGPASQGKSAWIALALKQYWMVITGILAAIFAFWATQQYAHKRVLEERERMLPKGGFVEVLVAARYLSSGERVSAETIAVRQVPREWMLPNALRPHEFDSVNQTALSKPLDAGNPLTLEHLRQAKGIQGDLALEPGFRAISIAVDEVSSVGGLIQPGDRVDLWGTTLSASGGDVTQILQVQPESFKASRPATLVAENLRVIATGQKTSRPETEADQALGAAYASITLAVPSGVAAAVLGGQFQGRLGVALRGPAESVSKMKKRRASAKPQELPVEILIGGVDGGF